MRVTKALRFMSLPAAFGLGTAVIIACSDAGPTSSDAMEVAPAFKKGKPGGGNASDATATTVCGEGYYLTTVNNFGSGADDNGDGYICKKGEPKK